MAVQQRYDNVVSLHSSTDEIEVRFVGLDQEEARGSVHAPPDTSIFEAMRLHGGLATDEMHDKEGNLNYDLYDGDEEKIVDLNVPIRLLPAAPGERTRIVTVQERSVGAFRRAVCLKAA